MSAWLEARLGSGWLEAQVSSARRARYGFIRDSTQLILNFFIAYYILYDISYTKHVNTDWFAFHVSLARSSARLRLARGSGQLGSAGSVRLYSGLDSAHLELGSGLCSELGLVRLSSVSGLSSGGADRSA